MVAKAFLLNRLLRQDVAGTEEDLEIISNSRERNLRDHHTAVVSDCVSNGLDFKAP